MAVGLLSTNVKLLGC